MDFEYFIILHITVTLEYDGDNYSLHRGCVLSSDVVVGAGVTLKEYTRVGSCRHPDEEVRVFLAKYLLVEPHVL